MVLSVYALFGTLSIFVENFSGEEVEGGDTIASHVAVSSFLYIVAIILPFTIKQARSVGLILVVLSFATLISASYFGIIGFVLLLTGGIAGIRWKEKAKANSALDVLKNRYASGDISKEEFEEKKKGLE